MRFENTKNGRKKGFIPQTCSNYVHLLEFLVKPSSLDRHLGFFHFLAIMNNGGMNILYKFCVDMFLILVLSF